MMTERKTIYLDDAMLKIAKVDKNKYADMSDFHDACVDCLKNLPSAQPERKTGLWILECDEDLATKNDKRFFNALKPSKEVDRSWGIGMKVPACPNCEAIISPMCFWENCKNKVGWCEYCGQKIDWSGWEEE